MTLSKWIAVSEYGVIEVPNTAAISSTTHIRDDRMGRPRGGLSPDIQLANLRGQPAISGLE